MLLPEQMRWTFHRVCIKEASTWMLPLEIDKCCRADRMNTGSIYYTAVSVQVELRDRMMETAAHLDTLRSSTFQSKTCADGTSAAAEPRIVASGVHVFCCLEAAQMALCNHKTSASHLKSMCNIK